MKALISNAFGRVEPSAPHFEVMKKIGPSVEQGWYYIRNPEGHMILRIAWDSPIEPGWSVTMSMWKKRPWKKGPLSKGADHANDALSEFERGWAEDSNDAPSERQHSESIQLEDDVHAASVNSQSSHQSDSDQLLPGSPQVRIHRSNGARPKNLEVSSLDLTGQSATRNRKRTTIEILDVDENGTEQILGDDYVGDVTAENLRQTEGAVRKELKGKETG